MASRTLTTIDGSHTILIDGEMGMYENNISGAGGNLYFEEDGLTLCDYDGSIVLPSKVICALRAAGYVVDESFD